MMGRPTEYAVPLGDLTVTVTRKAVKNLYLRILPPDGRVCVTAPRSAPEDEVLRFIRARQPWIERHRAALLARTPEPGGLVTGGRRPLWGRSLPLEVREGPREGAAVERGALMLTVRPGADEERRAAVLKAFYRAELQRAVPEVLARYEQITGVRAGEWRLRDMRTRWGTCSVRDRRVWLALRLAEYPPECLEYVTAHELTHLLEPSHNARFWALMDGFFPAWRAVRRRLRAPAAEPEE